MFRCSCASFFLKDVAVSCVTHMLAALDRPGNLLKKENSLGNRKHFFCCMFNFESGLLLYRT